MIPSDTPRTVTSFIQRSRCRCMLYYFFKFILLLLLHVLFNTAFWSTWDFEPFQLDATPAVFRNLEVVCSPE